MRRAVSQTAAADGVVCLSCGGGVQAVASVLGRPVVAGLDAHFAGTVERLGLFAGDRLVGGAIGYAFASPTGTDLVAVPDGPVLPWESPDAPAMFAALADGLRCSPLARRAVALRVEPRLAACPPPLGDLPRAPVDLVPTLAAVLGVQLPPMVDGRVLSEAISAGSQKSR